MSFSEYERGTTTSSASAALPAGMTTNMDYDKVLGLNHSILAERIVGRNVSDEETRRYKFTFKKALLEELDSQFERLYERKQLRIVEERGNVKNIDILEKAFFYLDAANRYLIHPGAFYMSHDAFTAKHGQNLIPGSKQHSIFLRRLKRNESRGRLLSEGTELYELFEKAAMSAWIVYHDVTQDWGTLGILSPSFVESAAQEEEFKDFLEAIKILIPCGYYREFEESILKIERQYPDNDVMNTSTYDLMTQIMNSPFIKEARRLLNKQEQRTFFGTSLLLRKKTTKIKGKIIKNLDQEKISDPLNHCLTIERILHAFLTWFKCDKNHFQLFNVDIHPSIFQERVRAEVHTKYKVNESAVAHYLRQKAHNEIERDRVALITEDADTALLTVTKSRWVKLYDITMERSIATMQITEERVSAFTSNKNWLVFGTPGGNLYLYNLNIERPKEPSCPKEDLFLTQKDSLTCMILNSKDDRLFVGCTMGKVGVWDLSEEDPKFTELPGIKNFEFHSVTCLCSDERMTMTQRYSSKLLFSGHANGAICVWAIMDKHRSELIWNFMGHEGEVSALVFKDKELISGGKDALLKVWMDIEKPRTDKPIRPSAVRRLDGAIGAIAIDYEAVIVSSDLTITFYDRKFYSYLDQFKLPDNGTKEIPSTPISSMTIDRRRQLYTVCKDIRIWNLENILHSIKLSLSKAKPNRRMLSKRRKSATSTQIEEIPELSYNTPMELILKNIQLRRLFNNFLIERYAEESLHFWMLVESYEYFAETCGGDGLSLFGMEIVAEHIRPDSPHPINISGGMQRQLSKLKEEDFNKATFNEAKISIMKLMEQNFRYKFIVSMEGKDKRPSSKA